MMHAVETTSISHGSWRTSPPTTPTCLKWRIVSYNCQSLLPSGRMMNIQNELEANLLCLQGTCVRAKFDPTSKLATWHTNWRDDSQPNYTTWHWTHDHNAASSDARGLSISVRRFRSLRKLKAYTEEPTDEALKGRVRCLG